MKMDGGRWADMVEKGWVSMSPSVLISRGARVGA